MRANARAMESLQQACLPWAMTGPPCPQLSLKSPGSETPPFQLSLELSQTQLADVTYAYVPHGLPVQAKGCLMLHVDLTAMQSLVTHAALTMCSNNNVMATWRTYLPRKTCPKGVT